MTTMPHQHAFDLAATHLTALQTLIPEVWHPICTDAEHQRAQQVARDLHLHLLHMGAEHPLNDLLDALEDRIAAYEDQKPHHRDPLAALSYLLDAHGLSVLALAEELHLDQSTLSKMLKGQRPFSKTYALKLSQKFGLSLDFLLAPRQET